ncbi:MAG: hypothetical protein U0324_34765 [Polyangiales bacterium]
MTPKRTEPNPLIERTKAAAAERHAARLAELTALVRRKMTAAVESFYDIGEALREVMDKGLFAAAGHATFDDFLAAEGLMGRRQATKLIAVARRVPREHALRLGHERAYALSAYAEAANDTTVAELVTGAATVAGKPAVEASLREIEAATREARARAADEGPRAEARRERSREDEALAKAVREALRGAGVGRPAVQVVGDEVRVVLTRAQAERLAG